MKPASPPSDTAPPISTTAATPPTKEKAVDSSTSHASRPSFSTTVNSPTIASNATAPITSREVVPVPPPAAGVSKLR